MKTNILADFQICISVSLTILHTESYQTTFQTKKKHALPDNIKSVHRVKTHTHTYTRTQMFYKIQKQSPRRVRRKRCFENMQQIYRKTPMPKRYFNKAILQLYRNHTSAWVFSCKFTAYFQNNFS